MQNKPPPPSPASLESAFFCFCPAAAASRLRCVLFSPCVGFVFFGRCASARPSLGDKTRPVCCNRPRAASAHVVVLSPPRTSFSPPFTESFSLRRIYVRFTFHSRFFALRPAWLGLFSLLPLFSSFSRHIFLVKRPLGPPLTPAARSS